MAQVSKTVVSNYLNGKYSSMSEGTRKRIQKLIEEYHYKPSPNRRNYYRKSTVHHKKVLGLILPDITDNFYSFICKGVANACTQNGYFAVTVNTDNNLLREREYIDLLLNQVDGFLVSTVGNNDEYLRNLQSKTNIVMIDRGMLNSPYDLISSNNKEAVEELLDYLLALQYEAFAIFTEQLQPYTARTVRVGALSKYLEDKNTKIQYSVHTISPNDEKVVMKELMGLYDRLLHKKIALIGVNGRTLLQILNGIKALGLEQRKNIGICGYDDFGWAQKMHSEIATISQPAIEIGMVAVQRLIFRVQSKQATPPEQIILKSTMQVFDSL